MSPADENQVKAFLLDMKLAVSQGRWTLIPRDKNLDDLSELNLALEDVVNILQSLRVDDYSQGPLLDDKGRQQDWWVFGPVYEEILLYVKIGLGEKKWVKCMSFHRAQAPLGYPLREGGQNP